MTVSDAARCGARYALGLRDRCGPQERGGEGPSSLSRAFFSAGARSVLAALWKVDDKATADLMVRFYRHLLRGSSKDEALRLAQMEVLAGTAGEPRAPHFWAAFQLSGDWR